MHTYAEVVDRAKVLKMFLFRCKSCINGITRSFMKFEAKLTTPVVWAGIQFKFWHWMFTYWATTLYPGPFSTSKHDRSTTFMMNCLTCWKPDLVELGFPHFLVLLLLIFQGKWAKMGYLADYCSVLPLFCCIDILYKKVEYSYKNDTNRASWWWGMTGWWWKVGFTPRAIRHVRRYWQLSSSGVISNYIWMLCLEVARSGTHTVGTF